MNIVIATDTYFPYISGISTSTRSIAEYMANHGHRVTVIAPKPFRDTVSTEAEKGFSVMRVWGFPDPFYPGRNMTLFPFILPAVDRAIFKDTDLVHIQEPLNVGIAAYTIARKKHIPIIAALHASPGQVAHALSFLPSPFVHWAFTRYIRAWCNRCDEVMTPTRTSAAALRDMGVVRPVRVVSNGVDTKKYVPGGNKRSIRKTFGLPEDAVLFLVLGRLDRDKSLDDIMYALADTQPRVHVVMAGEGPEKERLVALTQSLAIGHRVHWLGKLAEDAMVAACQCSDGFIIASLDETQSIVTLQAIASGLPVVAARAGALPELVEDGKSGFLVPPHDVQAFSQKMNILAGDPALRKKMGAEGRTIALSHDKIKALSSLEEWYQKVIETYQK